ncbi:MAG TPA: SdpI family protein [Mucilaginibacter sp.]
MIAHGIFSWLFGPQIMGLILLIIGVILHYFPPKKINNWYGYRTPASQQNQQTWDEANRYSAIYMMKCGLVVLVAGLLLTLIMNMVTVPFKIREAITVFAFLISGMLPAVLMIVTTEKHLTKTFGNP